MAVFGTCGVYLKYILLYADLDVLKFQNLVYYFRIQTG